MNLLHMTSASGESSSKQFLWLHPSPSLRTWFWNPELPVVVANTPLCERLRCTTWLNEFKGETAQSAPWPFFEAMDVTAEATRFPRGVQDVAALSGSAPSRARQSGHC